MATTVYETTTSTVSRISTTPPPETTSGIVRTWFYHRNATTTKGTLVTVTSIQPVVCPSEWLTALTTTVRQSVRVTCCPSGYSADPYVDLNYEANCQSAVAPGQTLIYWDSKSGYITTSYSTAVSVAAVAVKGWNSIVEAPATTTSAPLSSSPSSFSSFFTFSTTSLSTGSPNTIGNTTEPSGVSHSSGLRALMGVGIIFFLRRQRQERNVDVTSGTGEVKTKASDLKSGQYVNVPQNPGHRLSELPTSSNTPELYTDYSPHSPREDDAEIHELHLILNYTSSGAKHRLLFACRQLNTPVAPKLYSDVTLNVREEDQKSLDSHIAGLFRTIRDDQTLALYVRELNIKGYKLREVEAGYIPTSDDDKEDTTQQTHQPVRKKLEYPFWSENGFLPVIYQNCLKKLKKIDLGIKFPSFPTGRYGEAWENMQGSNSIDMNQLRNLMSLPLIESITCVASDGETGGDERQEVEMVSMPLAQNLTSIKFLRSKLALPAPGKILSATPNLRQLEYDFWIDRKLDEEPAQYYDCEQLDNALQPVRNILERLRLSVLYHGDHTVMYPNDWT
uniref:Uncharacterized protein n=1 Tax=Talaromyces marneffei PM1 TaxID=1077442 RepID=A0A093UQX1_TALMA